MANADFARGFVPVRHAASAPFNDAANIYFVSASDATALHIGDPVILNGSADSAGVAGVTRAAAAGAITGVVVGFVPNGTTDMAGYRAGGTAAYALVNDDPDTLYEIQEDGVGGALAAADVGQNIDIVIGAGNAYSRRSGVMLDSSTKAATATLPVRIVSLAQRPDNALGDKAKWWVRINNTTQAAATVAAAV